MNNSIPTGTVVLVVEDEMLIRMHAAQMLEDAGCHVRQAGDADAAITLLETHADIGVIFTDIDMPAGSMDGLRLAKAVRGRWPPVKIIATSGQVRIKDGDLPVDSRFLSKPYSAGQLTEVIHDLMAA